MPEILHSSRQGDSFQYTIVGAICGERIPDKFIYLHNDKVITYDNKSYTIKKLREWAHEEIRCCRRLVISNVSNEELASRIGSANVVLDIIRERE